jgi:hypothetical protein
MENLIRGWGRSVPEEIQGKITVTWGARAIYRQQFIDLLPDRSSWHVPGDPEVEQNESRDAIKRLGDWIDKKGLPFLREESKRLYPSEARVVTLDDGQFHIEASPQRSHGYLYIRAWELRADFTAKEALEHLRHLPPPLSDLAQGQAGEGQVSGLILNTNTTGCPFCEEQAPKDLNTSQRRVWQFKHIRSVHHEPVEAQTK